MQDTIIHSEKAIKICFVSPKAYPLFNGDVRATFGGAEVDLYYLGTELAKDARFDVSFVVADYGQPDMERRENVTVIKSLSFEQNPLTGAFKIRQALRKVNADIYMIKSISPGLFLVSLFCRLHRKIFLYRTAHATHCDGTYLEKHPLVGKFFTSSIRHAKKIFTQNEADKDNLKKTVGIDSMMIPNGHRFEPLTEHDRETILWAGRSADFKHPERFLDLAKTFPQEKFVMICQRATGDRQYDSLKTKAEAIENLNFIEHVRFDKIDSYFQQAKVFVNTSDSEGFPNTFIQACKAGTAILSYHVNPDGFLDTYECGVCCNGDGKAAVTQLGEMLNHGTYPALGQNGRAYVSEKHDIVQIVEKYKRYFFECIKST